MTIRTRKAAKLQQARQQLWLLPIYNAHISHAQGLIVPGHACT